MPKIDQPKLPVVKTTKKKGKIVNSALLKTKTKKVKSSPVDYYNCLLTYANQGWTDAKGTKKKITTCCKECKTKAPQLQVLRNQEVAQLITAYQQVGESLKKLLKPLK